MPELSRFFGIVIAMYYKDHQRPHFHAKYAGQTGVFSLPELRLIEGSLPKRVISLVLEWAFDHRDELAFGAVARPASPSPEGEVSAEVTAVHRAHP